MANEQRAFGERGFLFGTPYTFPMESCSRPVQEFPQRVPLKVIGRGAEMDPGPMKALIREHLGPQPEADQAHAVHTKGAFTAFTFWVTLPRDGAEAPLRAALQKLPGVVMQL
jgi:hypothetical protein